MRLTGLDNLHISMLRPELPDPGEVCCMGSAVHGPEGCTCWEPVYDLEQAEIAPGAATVRPTPCEDCAFRGDSPERQGDEEYAHSGTGELKEMCADRRGVFYCHQGMRRILKWRHPSGLEIEAHPASYQPPERDGVAYRADGRPADICAGFNAARETQ